MFIIHGRSLYLRSAVAVCATAFVFGGAGCRGGIIEATPGSDGGDAPDESATPGEPPVGEEQEPPGKIPRPPEDDGGGSGDMEDVCAYVSPGQTPMHRLTSTEWRNSVDDLFPSLSFTVDDIGRDEKVGPFAANTVSGVVPLQAETYQAASEVVSDRVLADLPDLLGCASAEEVALPTIEGEDLPGTTGRAQQDAYLIWANGVIEGNFETDASGPHTFDVRAWGSRAGSDLPHMTVTVDGTTIGEFDVDAQSGNPKTYTTSTDLEAGVHSLAIGFTNDFNDSANNADRNLWVDAIDITAGGVLTGDRACAMTFADEMVPRAWRRPLTEDERARFGQLYDAIAAEQGFGAGVRGIVEATLQSPHFLYRIEQGEGSGEEVVALTDYEVAARLSYFLWNSTPDAELMRAAEAGELSSAAEVRAQAERLASAPRAREAVVDAVIELLHLDDFEDFDKVDDAFTPELREAMYADTRAFVDYVLWEDDGQLATLLTAPYTFVSPETASFYGIDYPADGDGGPMRVMLDDPDRLGVLTQPAVLARHGFGQVPVHRGLFVRETFLCNRPPPPPNELVDPPETFEGQSMRSRAEGRLNHSGCGGCHQSMDPLGLAFDQFDTLGRWQTTDAYGNPVTSDGGVRNTVSTNADVDGPVELAEVLAGSEEVQECASRQWLKYAIGRDLSVRTDACTIAVMEEAVAQNNGAIVDLLIAITTTDAFRYRQAIASSQ